jgi:hypothetical protein
MSYIYNDGGREAAGYKGKTGDCVTRAIAIATGRPYQEVYNELFDLARERKVKGASPRNGVPKKTIREYMARLGWKWTPTMQIGSGCNVHLRGDELPGGRLIVSVTRHLVAVIDGQLHDTFDASRGGTRCVYGYWSQPLNPSCGTLP